MDALRVDLESDQRIAPVPVVIYGLGQPSLAPGFRLGDQAAICRDELLDSLGIGGYTLLLQFRLENVDQLVVPQKEVLLSLGLPPVGPSSLPGTERSGELYRLSHGGATRRTLTMVVCYGPLGYNWLAIAVLDLRMAVGGSV